MRIFLTGFMAAGKTTIGSLLAKKAKMTFVDLDAAIEKRAEQRIADLFDRHGESAFRRLERSALEEAAAREDVVVATGGGTMVAADNRRLMRRAGMTIWLDPPFEVLSERLLKGERKTRPLFHDTEQARELFRERRRDYETADLRLEIEAREPPEQVVSRILALLSKTACAT